MYELSKPRVEWLRWQLKRWYGQRIGFRLKSEFGLGLHLRDRVNVEPIVNGIYRNLWRTAKWRAPGLIIELRDCVFGWEQVDNLYTRRRSKRLSLNFPASEIAQWMIRPSVSGFVDALNKAEEVSNEVILLG